MTWSEHPRILEINTCTWLTALSRKHRRPVTLGSIPAADLGALIEPFDGVWLMGVWERSPRGREIALLHPGLQDEYRRALPDFRPEDVVGSPYSVRRYRVDPRLGGPEGLAAVRRQLADRGLSLVLDFVPNHVSIDHDWTLRNPSCLVGGTAEELSRRREEFFAWGDRVYAHGRDPYFPPWTDTAQLNAFSPEARSLVSRTLVDVAAQCDGIRCDMAMLVTNGVFARTWGERVGPPPAREFWEEVLDAVRRSYPGLLLIAEVYWDMEWSLQQQGFDFCYDKRLYDRMAHETADTVRAHLRADLGYQRKLLRFIENHDEPRAPVVFGDERSRAAALLMLTLPGAKLLHEGQTRGHRVRLPVQLGRRPEEADDAAMAEFYRSLLGATRTGGIGRGQWRLCDTEPHPSLIAFFWEAGKSLDLTVVNFGGEPIRRDVRIGGTTLHGRRRLRDRLSGRSFCYQDEHLRGDDADLELPPWSGYILSVVG